MNSNPQKAEELFDRALQFEPNERAAFLAGACGNDVNLRRRVEDLLLASEAQTGFLADDLPTETSATLLDDSFLTEGSGSQIGRYKLLEKLGEGGFGSVWAAEQKEPVRRRVALKIIKLGMDTKQVVARFEAERQALALMDHPNIAKVLDAGATDTGRPYFVMELVKGMAVTKYCNQEKLDTNSRLDLFIKVCQAIQHAHQKGIIHRDIKPSNIMVTLHDGMPVPKVIDFGIAKATQQELTEKTIYTQYSQFIGTPAYMSPEQAEMSGLDIDTRSDIYSLGVLLYELLTGSTPFDSKELMQSGLDEMRKIIREREPVRPSTRLSQTLHDAAAAGDRAMRPATLPSDLDWIVMRCLEKDRTHRYDTANALAMDLRRHLNNEPVVARPPSIVYRFQKSWKRNRIIYSAVFAIMVALLTGITASLWQANLAAREAKNARNAEQEQSRLRVEAENLHAREEILRVSAERRLYDSLVGQARALRIGGKAGYRDHVSKLLQRARNLEVPQKDLSELRGEAVACFGDFVGLAPVTWSDFPKNTTRQKTRLDPRGRIAAFLLSDGTITLRKLPLGEEIGRLRTERGLFDLTFSQKGDKLIALEGSASNANGSIALIWSHGADGSWSETKRIPVPGAFGCLSSARGEYAAATDSTSNSINLIDLSTLESVSGVQNLSPFPWRSAVAVSPNGNIFAVESTGASATTGSVVVLWDITRQQELARLDPGLSIRLNSIGFSHDGQYLSCFAENGGVIFSMDDFQRSDEFRDYFGDTSTISLAPDNTLVALPVMQQRRVRLWDRLKNADRAILEEPDLVTEATFSNDGKILLTSGPLQARVYRLDLTSERLRLAGHIDGVPGVCFNPDGSRIASAGKEGTVKVWDAVNGQLVWERGALPGPVQSVTYSPDGRWLVTAYYTTQQVDVWDAETGERFRELGTKTAGRTWSVAFSPDGNHLATAGNGLNVYKVDLGAGSEAAVRILVQRPGPFLSLAFSRDSQKLSFIENFDRLWAIDYANSTEPYLMRTPAMASVQSQSFTPDSERLLILGRASGDVLTLDAVTGNELSRFPAAGSEKPRSNASYVNNICLSPDGSQLALASSSSLSVEIWDPSSQSLVYKLPEEDGTVWWLAWSPDGQRLAISRANGDISVWNLKTIDEALERLELK